MHHTFPTVVYIIGIHSVLLCWNVAAMLVTFIVVYSVSLTALQWLP